MADFVAVLRKTLDGMGETTPATRERVYEKARATVAAKLAAINPPPPPSVADRQKRALEDAIASIEKEYAANSDPLAELEDVFASLKNPQPKVLAQPVGQDRSLAEGHAGSRRAAPSRTDRAADGSAAASGRKPAPAAAARPRRSTSVRMTRLEDFIRHRPDAVRKRSYGPLLVAAVMLAVIAGGGYGIWLNRDAFGDSARLRRWVAEPPGRRLREDPRRRRKRRRLMRPRPQPAKRPSSRSG